MAYVGCKCKAKGHVATDIYASMFLFIPLTLCEPQSEAPPHGWGIIKLRIGKSSLELDAIFEGLGWIVASFQHGIPGSPHGMNEHKSNNRSYSHAGVS